MRKLVTILKYGSLAALAAGAFTACGGGSNDQGVSVTLLGFFVDVPEDGTCSELGEPLGVRSIQLADPETEPENGDAGLITATAAVQNNLAGQIFRTERMFLTYEIPGAEVQPPSTNTSFTRVLGPGSTTGNSTLPPTFENVDPCAAARVAIVPAEIRSWINFNRASLPETPFTMVVHAQVTGVTSSGDRLNTNPADVFINFVDDNVIPPTGSDGSGDTGGEEEIAAE